MLDLSQIAVSTEKETQDFGKFVIEPLDQGYGHTIGNSLRRVLLTSLPGAAITQVKISGVRHQFTAMSGMSEDIVEFILNLKKVRLTVPSDKPVKLSLEAKGPKELKAKDISKTSGVEIINKDLTLAHLADSKSKLAASLIAENGTGYSLANDRKTGEIGVIPIDANFSPVTKVNYQVETTRVGRVTNFDKLTLEITTDGTMKPSEVLKQAAKILVDHFVIIHEPKTNAKKQKVKEDSDSVKLTEEVLNTSLEELDLPVRLTNSLRTGKIDTVGDFLERDKKDIMKMKNMGPKSISLVEEKLSKRGIKSK
ncbi:DNA-directed RNA polymerase subunit alpha [Candidatus Curtissbacteria bacterium RIFCSPLOWO2_01_FULL_39_62]|uniref:DNA-directed RNA polymerase subunit alpha n=2 Tax=Candidatus Curtissiibacteriota TaxID=1752717 RepID=A0A1F5G7G1_9BACT|nr:MAG: DNA-directed RNA polymerase subunit alpha [Candidatus Curtissbacteria bacterium RIFCSPHIGHO2_01_FULL_39_57]OGD87806.1 MAG: DNA-directed RNA polymerase subunit alpha [Candidatus Curtissbacteria bacterium RIFCSPHIGHO2_02_FULL_40_16b]OGD90559.1 MAG: DNA-directed RNA polymerase subunit alpha [Candidatus Curtissbacteria bacterium RIFCSPHIGHO2_12_FULL_38_37]OGD99824.1 MAG: DNA-directed RNA polymerase subunit alpha [Candidatus Curtissbacteria bacterium RIFCSPLOWO2_02_FULL_40_11]OGE01070.1 MAG: